MGTSKEVYDGLFTAGGGSFYTHDLKASLTQRQTASLRGSQPLTCSQLRCRVPAGMGQTEKGFFF